ncbi:hypothetical protein LOTGIDRAFT_165498 [Lottia gigantea]|uniref:Retrotransposon gag domain-containing protein n=1 Tax=Lottia gigantea TaxID=225164 RepID=V4BIZ6_LOTGI|nr:hypothetical protein LOTGIDRAFT_165498 [Lottia gigantea]ESO88714.1 hypothetical protein LOTGIDRAFT_165498 [Lottia gigantea]
MSKRNQVTEIVFNNESESSDSESSLDIDPLDAQQLSDDQDLDYVPSEDDNCEDEVSLDQPGTSFQTSRLKVSNDIRVTKNDNNHAKLKDIHSLLLWIKEKKIIQSGDECIEPARSLVRSSISDWNSWVDFRKELMRLFCTDTDRSYAAQMLSTLQMKSDEKHWTFMDRIRSLTYQAFSHEVMNFEGNMQFSQSEEVNQRITERLLQGIKERTLKGVIIGEINRNPKLMTNPDFVARVADETEQKLRDFDPSSTSMNTNGGDHRTRRNYNYSTNSMQPEYQASFRHTTPWT